jgi:glycine hydroxymethyltransferase
MDRLANEDPQIQRLVNKEQQRIESTLDLIAAESYPSPAIMEAIGSVFTIKTIEGYPGRRFHAGCGNADDVENLAIERGRRLFNAEFVNVQPHSGTSANMAVYFAVLRLNDPILAMSLPAGGHLSHGHAASITSRCFKFSHYGVDPHSGRIDYDEVRAMALRLRPRMIVAGASAYPRLIDYEAMAAIAAEIDAYLLCDMAHIAGLVAAGVIPSPVPHCDFVTFTLYKTMMAGRGGVVLGRGSLGAKLNRTIFPGCQGTSAVDLIAAKAVAFKMAMQPSFKTTQQRIIGNAKKLAGCLAERGYDVVTGGTDNHQVIVDVGSRMIDGRRAETVLEEIGLIANRNVIPQDAGHDGRISGLRLGTTGLSARGMGPVEVETIGRWIDKALTYHADRDKRLRLRAEVGELCRQYPVYANDRKQARASDDAEGQ